MTMDHSCTVRELVAGDSRRPGIEMDAVLTDPDTGDELHTQLASSADSVDEALAAAWKAHTDGVWLDLPADQRAATLRSLGAELAARASELGRADSIDSGVPQSSTVAFAGGVSAAMLEMGAARIESGFGHEETESAAGACDQWWLPWGPSAVFVPWNAPAVTAIKKVAAALVAGSPVIVKPSEWAPHFSGALADAVQAAGLAPGVVQILHGGPDVGAAIVADDRVAAVSYTGGVVGGRAVAEACGRALKPMDMELSGNNPVVVLDDADPLEVATQVLAGMLMLNGQICAGPRRLIVPRERANEYVDAIAGLLEGVPVGPTDEPATQLGPLTSEPHRIRIEEQLAAFADAGCEVRRYAKVPESGGHYLAPAIVFADAAPQLQEEVFGPVLLVRTYDEPEDAITIANDHPYGLSGYVFSADRDRARAVGRRLRAGLVRLNSAFGPPDAQPVLGMWGVSGMGATGGDADARFFVGPRFVG